MSTISFKESPGYKGGQVLKLNAALIVCTTVIVFLRLYVRAFMSRALGVDDLLAFLAYGCFVVLSALEIRSVQFGSGAHVQYVPEPLMAKFFEALVNNTLLYFLGTGLLRLSIVTFLPRLARDCKYSLSGIPMVQAADLATVASPTFVKMVYGVGVVIVAQTLGCFFYRLTECTPASDTWLVPTTPGLNCVDYQQENSMMVAHQTIGIILDFALLVLPLWVIYKMMMFSNRKIQVILVFSVGAFVIVTGIIRVVMLKTLLFLDDPTFNMSTIGPWTDLEGHVGLWCASFPALQPITRVIADKFGLRSTSKSSGKEAAPGNNRHTTVSKGQMLFSRSKSGYVRKGSGIDADDGSERAFAPSAVGTLEMDNFNLDDGGIRKTMDVEVSFENIPISNKEI